MTPLLSPQEIAATVARIASELSRDYRDRRPVFIGVLKGCFIFMADLVRLVEMPVEVEFVAFSSYGAKTTTSGLVKVVQGLRAPIRGKDVLVVEDIVDTGITLDFFLRHLECSDPASVRVCTLLDKESRRRVEVPVHYRGAVVPDRFLVGYGLDCNEEFRNLPGVYVLEED